MADQVTGNEGTPVTYDKAVEMINKFKSQVPDGTTLSYLVGINKFNPLLNQANIKGFRFYNCINDAGNQDLVIFAVDAAGNGLAGYILNGTTMCPPVCGGKP